LKIAVFWVVAPCSLVEVYQRFRGPCCLHHQGELIALMMEAARTQKTAIFILTAVRTSNPTTLWYYLLLYAEVFQVTSSLQILWLKFYICFSYLFVCSSSLCSDLSRHSQPIRNSCHIHSFLLTCVPSDYARGRFIETPWKFIWNVTTHTGAGVARSV
jgi:hypothetical protein